MRKRVGAAIVLASTYLGGQENSYSVLADTQLKRAQTEVEHVRSLVANGTLPRAKLTEAEEQLADAQDQDTLARTLYGNVPLEKMTGLEAHDMEAAAQRRVDRQARLVEERRTLLDNGVIARTEFESLEGELHTREQVRQLAASRVRLWSDLKAMAERERQAELMRTQSGTLGSSLIRFDGSHSFALSDLPVLARAFAKRFGHPLPVSAEGQTAVHTELGLDHHNRADVALNPESPEGRWFRQQLEQAHFSYLAFRSAVIGAATGPHIHVGAASTRLEAGVRR